MTICHACYCRFCNHGTLERAPDSTKTRAVPAPAAGSTSVRGKPVSQLGEEADQYFALSARVESVAPEGIAGANEHVLGRRDAGTSRACHEAEGRGQEGMVESLVHLSGDDRALPEGSRNVDSLPPVAPPRACRPTATGKERAESGGRGGVELGRKRRMSEDEAAGSTPVVIGRWERKFQELKSFMQQSGGHDYVCKPENLALYQWIASQR
jgi:hypothetical protein